MVKNVIIADDHPSWRGMYVDIVKGAFPDVHVDVVETGSGLVERVLQGDYSLVISDNDMEGHGDGLEALRVIRKAGNNVPFYVISGRNIGNEALHSGANGFYDKASFDSDKVSKDMAQYLR